MKHHYRCARDVYDLSEKIMQRCLDAPLALGNGSGLASLRRAVIVAEPRTVAADPNWPMTALEFCQRYELELAPATIETIEELLQRESLPKEAGTRFLNLLMQPGDVEQTLRRMHRTGLLRALLPELDACMGLVPYDPAHVWTVGEHTLRVLANLASLRPEAPPRSDVPTHYREIFADLESPATLYLGALLHDTGKQWPRGLDGRRAPHEQTGAERGQEICERLGAYPQRTESTVFLIRWHLLLAELSRLRDLGRPETIREVIRVVRDHEHLKMLFLLTWADTSAVGPGVWTDMAARLLDELFHRTRAVLEGEASTADPDEDTRRLDALRDRIRRRLARTGAKGELGVDSAVIQVHTEIMPAAYLLNTSLEAMGLHLAMIGTLTSGEAESEVVTDLRTLPGTLQTELTMVAYDDPVPGLLAKVTGVLYAYDVRLHAAQVFTRPTTDKRGIVVDTLVIDHRDQPLDRAMRTELATALGNVLGGRETIAELLQRRRRPEPALGLVQNLRLEANEDGLTLLDVVIARGPGAIHALSKAITSQGWNIHAARLSSWAGSIRCAVYVSEAVDSGEQEAAYRRLRAALGQPKETSPTQA